jgi:hypothetical protein
MVMELKIVLKVAIFMLFFSWTAKCSEMPMSIDEGMIL